MAETFGSIWLFWNIQPSHFGLCMTLRIHLIKHTIFRWGHKFTLHCQLLMLYWTFNMYFYSLWYHSKSCSHVVINMIFGFWHCHYVWQYGYKQFWMLFIISTMRSVPTVLLVRFWLLIQGFWEYYLEISLGSCDHSTDVWVFTSSPIQFLLLSFYLTI